MVQGTNAFDSLPEGLRHERKGPYDKNMGRNEEAANLPGNQATDDMGLFSPEVRWIGSYQNRAGWSVHALQIASYGVRPRKVFNRLAKL